MVRNRQERNQKFHQPGYKLVLKLNSNNKEILQKYCIIKVESPHEHAVHGEK